MTDVPPSRGGGTATSSLVVSGIVALVTFLIGVLVAVFGTKSLCRPSATDRRKGFKKLPMPPVADADAPPSNPAAQWRQPQQPSAVKSPAPTSINRKAHTSSEGSVRSEPVDTTLPPTAIRGSCKKQQHLLPATKAPSRPQSQSGATASPRVAPPRVAPPPVAGLRATPSLTPATASSVVEAAAVALVPAVNNSMDSEEEDLGVGREDPRAEAKEAGQPTHEEEAETDDAAEAEDPALEELRTWLNTRARIKRGRVPWVVAALRERGVCSLKSLQRHVAQLEPHIPAAAYAMITTAVAADAADAEEVKRTRQLQQAVPEGLRCKFVWHGRSGETILPFTDLESMASVGKLVNDLARRGNALLNVGKEVPAVPIKPSLMRVEYKRPDRKTGVMQRVQLTPQSQIAELGKAESLLIKPHDDAV